MIIFKANVEGITFMPRKCSPPLLIDADGVPGWCKPLQGMKLIGWGKVHVFEPRGRIQLFDTPPCFFSQFVINPLYSSTMENIFGFLIAKGFDHGLSVITLVTSVNHHLNPN